MAINRDDYLGLSYFVQPVPALAVGLLILNDRWLKAHYGGLITGKLSDLSGVFFFPLFLCALYGLLVRATGRHWWLSREGLWVAIFLTDLIFVGVKLFPFLNETYVHALTAMGFPSHLVCDPGDLLALAMNPLTYLYARRFWATAPVTAA